MRTLAYPLLRSRPPAAGGAPNDSPWPRAAPQAARRPAVPRVVVWLLLLFVASIPFEAANLGVQSVYLSIAKLSGLGFFALYFFFFNPALRKRALPAMPAALWWFLGYVGVYAMSAPYIGEDLLPGFLRLLATLVQLLALFWVLASLLQNEKLARAVLLTFAGATLLLAIAVLIQLPGFSTAVETKAGERVTSLDNNPNVLATIVALAAVILMGLQLEAKVRRRWQKLILAATLLPLLGVVVQTGSRAGMVACALGFLVFLISKQGLVRRRKGAAIVMVGLGLASLGYLVVTSSMALVRLQEAYEGQLSGRDKINAAALDMIAEKPIFGWQPVAFWQELGRRVGLFAGTKDAHNLFLHLLLEVGLIGTIPFLIGLGLCLRCAWKARAGPLGVLPLALLLAVLSANLSHTYLTRKPFWLVLALCVAAYEISFRKPATATAPAGGVGPSYRPVVGSALSRPWARRQRGMDRFAGRRV